MRERYKKLFLIVFFLVLSVVSCIYIYNKFNNKEIKTKDGAKFAQEYRLVNSDNSFIYKKSDEIIKILEKGTGIVYLGFPECPWCQNYVKYLDEIAKEEDVNIYYYNIAEDRKNNTEVYKRLLELLKGTLQFDKEGNERIYVPHVAVVIKGQIIASDYETSLDTGGFKEPSQYWTKEKQDNLKNKLKPFFEKVFVELNSCSECND